MEQQRGKKDNGGYLFRNKNKASDKQPDYRGKINVNGKEMLISGWIRMQEGEEMISLSLTDPSTLPPKAAGAGAPAAAGAFARPAAPAAAAAAKPAAAPAANKPKDDGYSELDDLDGLFNGMDD